MIGVLIATRPRSPGAGVTCSARSGWRTAATTGWRSGRPAGSTAPRASRATVRQFADAGVERIMLQDFVAQDLDMIDLMGEELIGQV